LAELEALSASEVHKPVDVRMADLKEQLRRAAYHLEKTLDHLMPMDF